MAESKKKKVHWNRLNRQVHYWGAMLCALPVLIVIGSGILLMLKKDFDWIQPPTQRGESKIPTVSFEQILAAAKTVPEAKINSWDDIDRLDVRPGKGIIKLQAGNNRLELQIDQQTGEIMQTAYRRSDLIESIHDGSFFSSYIKTWVFLPSAIVLFVLWVTGIWLFVTPLLSKRKRKAKKEREIKNRDIRL